MQSIKQYKGLPKEIYVLFLATIVNRMGDFIFPFLTLFLKSKIGLNAAQIGNILVWSTVLYILGTAVGGKLADHFQRKRVYIICTGTSILLMGICAMMQQGYEMVYLLITSQVFLRIATPAMDAMKMDLTNRSNRQVSFSLIYLGINIGVAIGPIIAGILFAEHIRILFIGDIVTSIIALSLIMRYVRDEKKWDEKIESQSTEKERLEKTENEDKTVHEVKTENEDMIVHEVKTAGQEIEEENRQEHIKEKHTEEKCTQEMQTASEVAGNALEQAESGSLWAILIKRPNLIAFCCICCVLSFIYAQGNFMLPLHLEEIYSGADGSRYFGYLMAINAVTVVVTTPYILGWTKTKHSLTNILLATICYIAGFGMYGLMVNKAGFVIGTILWTLGEILYTTNSGVYIANHSPISHRARFQSVYIIVLYIGKTLAPLIMGQYLMGHSLVQGWHIIAFIGIAAVGMILAARQSDRKQEVK